jgi:hypothetical protein
LEYWSIGVLRFPRIAPRNRELGAVLHHSNTPILRAAGFEDEDENEAPDERRQF